MHTHTMMFPEWGGFVDCSLNGDSHIPFKSRCSVNGTYMFTGCDFKESRDMLQNGWPEGADKVKKVSDAFFESMSSVVEQQFLNYDVEGAILDVARFVEGEPECWQVWNTRLVEGESTKYVTILFNCSVSWQLNRSVIEARGAAVAALIELLEYSGRRVELWISEAGYGSCKLQIFANVKRFDQHLDFGRIAYTLTHPGFFRRSVFAVMETAPEDICRKVGIFPGGNYGIPAQAEVPEDIKPNIYIGHALYGEPEWMDEEFTAAWIRKTLKEQGVRFKDEQESESL